MHTEFCIYKDLEKSEINLQIMKYEKEKKEILFFYLYSIFPFLFFCGKNRKGEIKTEEEECVLFLISGAINIFNMKTELFIQISDAKVGL